MKNIGLVMMSWILGGFAAINAYALPTWIGVYGSYQRHDGGNPGTFTILMNQDYVGLNAEVGIRINDGAWTTLPMSYAGHVEGNSMWTATPSQVFPAGATVTYYFHGWDHQGHLWDSQGGANYSFEVSGSGGGTVLTFDDGRIMPEALRSASSAGLMYTLRADQENLRLSKSYLPLGAWSPELTVATSPSSFLDPLLAASANELAVVYREGQADLKIRYSVDHGDSFAAARIIPEAGRPLGLAWTPNRDLVVVFAESSQNGSIHLFSRKSSDHGVSWSGRSTLASFPATSSYPGLTVRVVANNQAVFVGYTYSVVDGRQFGSGELTVAVSANGLSWSAEKLGNFDVIRGNTVMIDMAAEPNAVYLGASTTPRTSPQAAGAPRVWRRGTGAWQWADLPGPGSSNPIYVEPGPDGSVVFVESGFHTLAPKVYVSENGGASFGPARDFASPTELGTSRQLLRMHGVALSPTTAEVYLVWWGYQGGGAEPMYRLQRAAFTTAEPLEAVGPSHHFPGNGSLQSSDDLWINTETRPAGSASRVRVVYSKDGAHWDSQELVRHHTAEGRDLWHVNLGSFFAAGEAVQYAVEGVDIQGNSIWDNNRGDNYLATVEGGNRVPVEWIGHTIHWPHNGSVQAGQTVWINTQTWPGNTPAEAFVVYSVNGGSWQSARLNFSGYANNNDQWHFPLGTFSAGTRIQYAVAVFDSFGNQRWDSNGGRDYLIQVNP